MRDWSLKYSGNGWNKQHILRLSSDPWIFNLWCLKNPQLPHISKRDDFICTGGMCPDPGHKNTQGNFDSFKVEFILD